MKKAFSLAESAAHADKSEGCRKIAFTLAETLITLGIIGIVSAIILPTIIANHQKKSQLHA